MDGKTSVDNYDRKLSGRSPGEIIYSAKLNHVNQSVIELDDGDVVMGGFGFREGNSGGPISLLRLDPSSLE